MIQTGHVITEVLPGSIAEELEVVPGDVLLRINGEELQDIFDYDFLCQDEYLQILIRDRDGDEVLLEVEKDEDEDLGLRFGTGLMDEYRSCRNQCIFCFIDQMPPGMRETLYFKDDDSRLSFLQGNYVTLTNMSDADIERIIRYRLGPINISVHTMNPELRCRMLHNRFAGEALEKIGVLAAAGIPMNAQIVLCPGYNDGEELTHTIRGLMAYAPVMQSVSVVPVGLTRYRTGLPKIPPVTPEIAETVIDAIESWQRVCYKKYGLHFVHASDEFYILAGREMPEELQYDGYLQLENGVGFVRLLQNEFTQALSEAAGDMRIRHVTSATGTLIAPYIRNFAEMVREKYPRVEVRVRPIRNDFFGEKITVSGLVTGGDLIAQLKELALGQELLIPENMLRSGERVFLDDITVYEVEEHLGLPVRIVGMGGSSLLRAMLGEEELTEIQGTAGYEPDQIP